MAINNSNGLPDPSFRPLKVYAFDPTRGQALGNHLTLNVRYENLAAGPVGHYLEVIDFDANNQCYYQPVNLDDPGILIRNGLDPSESNPQFHQQMVYAVASETIRRFERALGRRIRWSFHQRGGRNIARRSRLRIFPHAMQEANAYYHPGLRALVFGYFAATGQDTGANLPGQIVYTCLSHDIIAHETAHALVDSQRQFFMEATGPDSPAFHEAFADIVALFQHFSYQEVLADVIQRIGGRIYNLNIKPETVPDANQTAVIQTDLEQDNPLVGLARQFGEALGGRQALRSALGTPPNTNRLREVFEPHERGAILVAAVFDAYFSIYLRRVADLLRIARAGGATLEAGSLPPDLVNRLAETASKTAEQFFNICVRALDYCPPLDITFGDFLRALITADAELVPDDPHEYRAAIIQAFRSRGIVPQAVASYSEEALRWPPPEVDLPDCKGLSFDIFGDYDPLTVTAAHRARQARNATTLQAFAEQHRATLGLAETLPLAVTGFHPVYRITPDGQLRFDVIAEVTQKQEVLLDPSDAASPKFIFRGGATLILSQTGAVRFFVTKPLGNLDDDPHNKRLQRQRAYLRGDLQNSGAAAYDSNATLDVRLNFGLIHREN